MMRKEMEVRVKSAVKPKSKANGLVRVITSRGKYDYVKKELIRVYVEKGYIKALA